MIESTQDLINQYIDREPERGPYSNSRLSLCDQEFYYSYETDEPERVFTRYGRSSGTAAHKLAELDVSARTKYDRDNWPSVEQIVDQFVAKRPEYNDHFDELNDMMVRFRGQFPLTLPDYVGSEERLGMTLDFNRARFKGDSSTWYRGVIDYLEIDDGYVATVTDFKNRPKPHAWRKLTSSTSDISKQLLGYLALVMANYPEVRQATCQVYYFQTGQIRQLSTRNDHGEYKPKYFTRDDIKGGYWRRRQREMIAKERQEKFPPQPTRRRCQYCDYPDKCPFWDERDLSDELAIQGEAQAEEMLKQFVVLNEKRKRLNSALSEWAKEMGVIETDSGEWLGYKPYTKRRPHTRKFLRRAAELLGYDQDEDESVQEFIDAIAPSISLTKGSADSFAKTFSREDQEALMEEGYVERQKTRKRKSF